MDCDDSVNKILYLTHTDREGPPPNYFGRSYKMPEMLADKIKHYSVKFGKQTNYEKQPEGEAYARQAFLSEKVAFEI